MNDQKRVNEAVAGFTRNAMKAYPKAVPALAKSADPAKLAGQMAGMLAHTMLMNANERGVKIPQVVMSAAVKNITEDMVKLAGASGSLKVKSQEDVTQAMKVAASEAGKAYVRTEMSAKQRGNQNGR